MWAAVCVAEMVEELWVLVDPIVDTLDDRGIIRAVPTGFEVVGDADQDMDRPAVKTVPATGLEQIRKEPTFEGLLSQLADH